MFLSIIRRPGTLAAFSLIAAGCTQINDLFNSPSGLAIQKFTASPKEAAPGSAVTLSWEVQGAESIQIDNGIGAISTKKGSTEVRVSRTATYTLQARAGTTSATASTTVNVTGTGASPSPSVTPSPTPSPSGTPVPSPTPSPSPSATPTPTPSPSPSASACRLPAMPECGAAEGPRGVWGCCREEKDWVFGEIVEKAIAKIQAERPELFRGDQVRDGNAYVRGVAEILQRDFGVCAKQGGPEDELGVKNSNGWNEQFDILLSSGRIRHDGYTVTCRPARF